MKKLFFLILLTPTALWAKPDIRIDSASPDITVDAIKFVDGSTATIHSSTEPEAMQLSSGPVHISTIAFIYSSTGTLGFNIYIGSSTIFRDFFSIVISSAPGMWSWATGEISDDIYYEKYEVQWIDRKTGKTETQIFNETEHIEAYRKYQYLLAHPKLYRKVEFFYYEPKKIIFYNPK